jgi:hypothetical protein
MGNSPNTPANDSTAIVFLSGPYATGAVATRYAGALRAAELAEPGGRWVASAALTSKLDTQVKVAASCMAGAA